MLDEDDEDKSSDAPGEPEALEPRQPPPMGEGRATLTKPVSLTNEPVDFDEIERKLPFTTDRLYS